MEDFIKLSPDVEKSSGHGKSNKGISLSDFQTQIEYDPTIVLDLIKCSERR